MMIDIEYRKQHKPYICTIRMHRTGMYEMMTVERGMEM